MNPFKTMPLLNHVKYSHLEIIIFHLERFCIFCYDFLKTWIMKKLCWALLKLCWKHFLCKIFSFFCKQKWSSFLLLDCDKQSLKQVLGTPNIHPFLCGPTCNTPVFLFMKYNFIYWLLYPMKAFIWELFRTS